MLNTATITAGNVGSQTQCGTPAGGMAGPPCPTIPQINAAFMSLIAAINNGNIITTTSMNLPSLSCSTCNAD